MSHGTAKRKLIGIKYIKEIRYSLHSFLKS